MPTELLNHTGTIFRPSPSLRAPRLFDKGEVLLFDFSSVSSLRLIRENSHWGVFEGSAAMPTRPVAPGRIANTSQRCFILQTHVLSGPALPDGHIAKQVALEQSISRVLGMGLFAPFHIKTLKRLTGTASFDRCPLTFLALLLEHRASLLCQRHVALVIDDLAALVTLDLDRAVHLMEALVLQGFLILIKPHVGQAGYPAWRGCGSDGQGSGRSRGRAAQT
jgi:hypothetical protein